VPTQSKENPAETTHCYIGTFSTAIDRFAEPEWAAILERKAFNEIPPRVEYKLTMKGHELVESIIGLLQWIRKWSDKRPYYWNAYSLIRAT